MAYPLYRRDVSRLKYDIEAIATPYKGILFRSQLEAHWAAFFDLLGWQWEYEPAQLDGWWPDFFLSHAGKRRVAIEVKPFDLSAPPTGDVEETLEKLKRACSPRQFARSFPGIDPPHIPYDQAALLGESPWRDGSWMLGIAAPGPGRLSIHGCDGLSPAANMVDVAVEHLLAGAPIAAVASGDWLCGRLPNRAFAERLPNIDRLWEASHPRRSEGRPRAVRATGVRLNG